MVTISDGEELNVQNQSINGKDLDSYEPWLTSDPANDFVESLFKPDNEITHSENLGSEDTKAHAHNGGSFNQPSWKRPRTIIRHHSNLQFDEHVPASDWNTTNKNYGNPSQTGGQVQMPFVVTPMLHQSAFPTTNVLNSGNPTVNPNSNHQY